MSERIAMYLVKKKSVATPEVAEMWQKLERLYTKKLWHQLTVELRKCLDDSSFTNNLDLKEFYDSFIKQFEHRINALQLVEISISIAKYIYVAIDKESAYAFLSKIGLSATLDKKAVVRLTTGQIELRLMHKDEDNRCVDIQVVRKLIEATQELVDQLNGVTPVHAPFYKVSSIYLKEVGNYAAYYREALRYLGCENKDNLSSKEKHLQAVLLGFAAIIGDDVYNFGELLAHPILTALKGTKEEWIIDVLYAFNSGNLNMFYSYKPKWHEWEDLVSNENLLKGKIRILSVMELALGRPSKERYITFDEIAANAQIEKDQVEFLVMKALSKKLIRGSIDQVNEKVNITWVQPRVLSPQQITNLNERIGMWCKDVIKMEEVVTENAKEILTKS